MAIADLANPLSEALQRQPRMIFSELFDSLIVLDGMLNACQESRLNRPPDLVEALKRSR